MGTLTADCPRLDAHCPHKLATSCRLTSTPNCCACADERVHSRTYRVYIDGVGFVQRGTRWQGYCWFCKEFWTNRLAATYPPLEISQTRIPDIPDQTEFLERWFEFHQGYRVAKLQDGTEQRMPVLGEPFKEVSPGFLPRTLDQLRAGVENDARRPENRIRRRRLSSEDQTSQEPQQSLESALDSLLAEASEDETHRPSVDTTSPIQSVPTQPEQPRPLTRAEERARERFGRVFGTREDLQQEDYESPLSTIFNRADDRYRQAEELRATDATAPPPLDGLSAQERREIEEQLLWGVMRESRTYNEPRSETNIWSYTPRRVPGESSQTVDAESLPADHVSLTSWLNSRSARSPRVYGTGSAPGLESIRRERPTLPDLPTISDHPQTSVPIPDDDDTEMAAIRRRLAALDEIHRDLTRTERSEPRIAQQLERTQLPSTSTIAGSSEPHASSSSSVGGSGMSQIQNSIQQITSELQQLRLASEAITSARHSMHSRYPNLDEPVRTLDNQPGRPPPMSSEEMTKTLECQVCYQQLADTAVLPCGHMVMCKWCADVVIPVRHSHWPTRPSKCPMCRKPVKQRFRIRM